MKFLWGITVCGLFILSRIGSVNAEGSSGVGVVSSLSYEVVGTYVQLVNADNEIITTNPNSCGESGDFFLPTKHPNYEMLSSSLLTAHATKQPLSLLLSGCYEGTNKISFVRFGNWTGVHNGSPTTYDDSPQVPPSESTVSAIGITINEQIPTANDSCTPGEIVFAKNIGKRFICGGQDSSGFEWFNLETGQKVEHGNSPLSLVLHLSFDEEAILNNTVLDSSPSKSHQNKTGGMTVAGVLGEGLDLHSTSHIAFDSSIGAFTKSSDFTVSVWVKPAIETDYSAGSHHNNIVSHIGPITRANLFSSTDGEYPNEILLASHPSGASHFYKVNKPILNGHWYNVVISWRQATRSVKVFLDGEFLGVFDNSPMADGYGSKGMVLGGMYFPVHIIGMTGRYDEFKLYEGYINDQSHTFAELIYLNSF